MVAKGNKDGHRYSYSGGVKAVEKSKWGHDVARQRYGITMTLRTIGAEASARTAMSPLKGNPTFSTAIEASDEIG
jgi:hypothetical protein